MSTYRQVKDKLDQVPDAQFRDIVREFFEEHNLKINDLEKPMQLLGRGDFVGHLQNLDLLEELNEFMSNDVPQVEEEEFDPSSRRGLMVKYLQSRDQKNFPKAKTLLAQLEADPGYLPIDQLRAELERLEREGQIDEQAKRDYEDLVLLNKYEQNKEIVYSAFRKFRRDYPDYDPANLALINPVNSLLETIQSINSTPHERLEAGRKLAVMPDPREGVSIDDQGVPQFDWCEIPAGQFHMGGDTKVREIREDTLLDIPYIFWVSRYPITYSQFEPFVREGGYDKEEYWSKAGWKWCRSIDRKHPKIRWNEPQWHLANMPIVGTNWYESFAYTQWLNSKISKLNKPNYKATKWIVRLMTEAEWEKAARGPNGNFFPYGNDPKETAANIQTLGLGQPCSVGVFPEDKSPYGVMDMAGNTWEWVISEIDHDLERELINESSEGRRIIKGGSYKYYSEYSRCASYAELRPELETAESSFRLCLIDSSDQNSYFTH